MSNITCSTFLADISDDSFVEISGFNSITAQSYGITCNKSRLVLSDIESLFISSGFGIQLEESNAILSNVKSISSLGGVGVAVNNKSNVICKDIDSLEAQTGISVSGLSSVVGQDITNINGTTFGILASDESNSTIKLQNINKITGNISIANKSVVFTNIKTIQNNVEIKTDVSDEGSHKTELKNVNITGNLTVEQEQLDIKNSTITGITSFNGCTVNLLFNTFSTTSVFENSNIKAKRNSFEAISAENSILSFDFCKATALDLTKTILNGKFLESTQQDYSGAAIELYLSEVTNVNIESSSLISAVTKHSAFTATDNSSVILSATEQTTITNTDSFFGLFATSFSTGTRAGSGSYIAGALSGGTINGITGNILLATFGTLNTLSNSTDIKTDTILSNTVGSNFVGNITGTYTLIIGGAMSETMASLIQNIGTTAAITAGTSYSITAPTVSII